MIRHPRIRRLVTLGGMSMFVLVALQARRFADPERPPPTIANIRYGFHERNVFDIWKAKPKGNDSGPRPLVVFFHGGGFRQGDKVSVPIRLLKGCLDRGISVASANYRLSHQAIYPAPMLDGALAIQYIRANAKELGIDPRRIAASGDSAGAGISLWIGFHDDLADPKSDDPVARESTRLTCMGVNGAQASYDPRFIKALIGGRAHEHPALPAFFGMKRDEDATDPAVIKRFEESSPINYISKDDPPVFLLYAEPKGPIRPDARVGEGIHHPKFGDALKAKLEPLGIECRIRHRDDYPDKMEAQDRMWDEVVAFFDQKFKSNQAR
jgi:acetyl esterase/lipase